MGITFLKVRVSNPASPRKGAIFEFLVDSGAIYSVLPTEALKRLGIKATSFEEFTLANGEIIRKPVGNALFGHGGKVRAAPVIFGDPGIRLLGATTLEALGVILDPINRTIRPLPMVLMPQQPDAHDTPPRRRPRR